MNRAGITRRQFTVALAALAAGACTPAAMPRMGEGPPRVPVRSAFRLGGAPVKGAEAKFAFEEIHGAPAGLLTALSQALRSEAAARNLTVVSPGDPSATYIVKGYLSAIGDRGGTLLVHVWDVNDSSGKRLHRVSGQEAGDGSSADPWSGIDERMIKEVAARAIDDLASWVA